MKSLKISNWINTNEADLRQKALELLKRAKEIESKKLKKGAK